MTNQISKRVQLLISTSSAITQATQRVRKAHKRNVPIVSIDWLFTLHTNYCKQQQQQQQQNLQNNNKKQVVVEIPAVEDYLFDDNFIEEAIAKHNTNSNEKEKHQPVDDNNDATHEVVAVATEHTTAEDIDILNNMGWTKPKELGCCCVCHENGSEKDCQWCVDCVV